MSNFKRADFELIKKWVGNKERVLDLGCENGQLLKLLKEEKNAQTLGIEIDCDHIINCIGQGIDVIQVNLDDGLDMFENHSFDVVVMSETIQALVHPIVVMKEMMRIGKRCIITFPNFAYLPLRYHLFFKGKMPMAKHLPYQWYDTPNIHFCTVKDFEKVCQDNGFVILNRTFLGNFSQNLINKYPNLLAKTAIYQLQN